jgi:hypothetical protein
MKKFLDIVFLPMIVSIIYNVYLSDVSFFRSNVYTLLVKVVWHFNLLLTY